MTRYILFNIFIIITCFINDMTVFKIKHSLFSAHAYQFANFSNGKSYRTKINLKNLVIVNNKSANWNNKHFIRNPTDKQERILIVYYPLQLNTSYRSVIIDDYDSDFNEILHMIDKKFLDLVTSLHQSKVYDSIMVKIAEKEKMLINLEEESIAKYLFMEKSFYDSPDYYCNSESFYKDYINYIQNTKAFIDIIYFDSISDATSIVNKFRYFNDSNVYFINFMKSEKIRINKKRLKNKLDNFRYEQINISQLGVKQKTILNHSKIANFFNSSFYRQTDKENIGSGYRVYKKESEDKSETPETRPAGIHCYNAGMSVENHPIECLVFGKGKESILIIASIHGNESAGTPLVWMLADYLRKNQDVIYGKKIILLPNVNPDSVIRNSRYNTRGVDLNRNFEAMNRRNARRYGFFPLSEPETRSVARVIDKYKPARILSFHQPFACIDYDGPAKALAFHMAKFCNLPVRKLGALPGSLGSYAGLSLNIPVITLELPEHAETFGKQHMWKVYGNALMAFVLWPDFSKEVIAAEQ